MALSIIIYVALCALVGYVGRERKFGLLGYSVASLLLSPIIGFILVLASDKKSDVTADVAAQAS